MGAHSELLRSFVNVVSVFSSCSSRFDDAADSCCHGCGCRRKSCRRCLRSCCQTVFQFVAELVCFACRAFFLFAEVFHGIGRAVRAVCGFVKAVLHLRLLICQRLHALLGAHKLFLKSDILFTADLAVFKLLLDLLLRGSQDCQLFSRRLYRLREDLLFLSDKLNVPRVELQELIDGFQVFSECDALRCD